MTGIDANGATRVSGATYLGYAGGGLAFILSLLGALENAGQLIASIEGSMDTWLEVYSGGAYKDVIQDAEQSSSMQKLVNLFTLDLIIFACASMWHSFFIMGVGFGTAGWIFL